MSKDIPNDRYAVQMIENYFKLGKENNYDSRHIQKLKFEALTKLVNDLFKYKNSTKCFNTISNLIMISLTALDDSPPDLFEDELIDEEQIEEEYIETLKEEFKKETQYFERCLNIENEFRETLSRFMNQYDLVSNVELVLTPKKYNNGYKGYPN